MCLYAAEKVLDPSVGLGELEEEEEELQEDQPSQTLLGRIGQFLLNTLAWD
jgi:hypothetical protein